MCFSQRAKTRSQSSTLISKLTIRLPPYPLKFDLNGQIGFGAGRSFNKAAMDSMIIDGQDSGMTENPFETIFQRLTANLDKGFGHLDARLGELQHQVHGVSSQTSDAVLAQLRNRADNQRAESELEVSRISHVTIFG
jgi:hypothetical protein